MPDNFDVLGLGAVTVDFTGTVAAWPREGGRMLVQNFALHGGGLVGTALAAAARLGGRVGYAGMLGSSPLAERAIADLEREGIDTSLVVREPGAEPMLAFIYANPSDGQRTILWTRSGARFPLPDELPDPRWLERTRVFLFDGESGPAGVAAARAARARGLPVVLDIIQNEEHVPDAIRNSSHIIVSQRFAGLYTGGESLPQMLRGMRADPSQTVVITRGEHGCVGLSGGREFSLPAFRVEALETTGCGDAFHGAFALALAQGRDDLEAARFASAVGALCATRTGGRDGLPTRPELDRFLAGR
jgi:sulfofructose kinase